MIMFTWIEAGQKSGFSHTKEPFLLIFVNHVLKNSDFSLVS